VDWNAAIGRNREALKRALAMLVAMSGLDSGGRFYSAHPRTRTGSRKWRGGEGVSAGDSLLFSARATFEPLRPFCRKKVNCPLSVPFEPHPRSTKLGLSGGRSKTVPRRNANWRTISAGIHPRFDCTAGDCHRRSGMDPGSRSSLRSCLAGMTKAWALSQIVEVDDLRLLRHGPRKEPPPAGLSHMTNDDQFGRLSPPPLAPPHKGEGDFAAAMAGENRPRLAPGGWR
jgi:hypothetical protein